uniref:Uncharacterized protein n=1 Tax=viral metagenome TaxID=1070528 RepID=A0A6C0BS58_9ZZZZ
MNKVLAIILFILFFILILRITYLYFDDTHNLQIIDNDKLYNTYYNDKKLIFNYSYGLDDDEYHTYLSLCESDILKIDNELRLIELKVTKCNKKLTPNIVNKNLSKIDYIYQRLGFVDSFLFKIPFLEEINDRITFYYKYMNDNNYVVINNIPVYQISKHHHAVEYVYKKIQSNPGTILHVDTHADMNPIKNTNKFFKNYINQTERTDIMNKDFDDLITDIGGVLVPMLLPYDKNNGIFWITPDWVTEPYNSSNIKIALNDETAYFYGGTCPKYTIKRDDKMIDDLDLDVYFTTSNIKYAKNKIDNISNNYILNIDLDYFVCFGGPLYGLDGNDTISHYRTILDLGYALKDDRESEIKETELYNEMHYILKRIDNFLVFIKELKLKNKIPSMIILCDSTRVNFSNYKNNEKKDSEIVHEFMPKYLCFWVHNIVLTNLKKILQS